MSKTVVLISDIELWCPDATLCEYADDTSSTITNKDLKTLQINCEEKVNELLTYMAVNRLSANDDKTKILVMKHGNSEDELTFNIGNFEVKESTNEKLLGMWVSNNLQWSKHIEELEDDLSFRLFTIRKLEQSFPKSLLIRLADAVFNSVLRYGLGIICPIRTNERDPTPKCMGSECCSTTF